MPFYLLHTVGLVIRKPFIRPNKKNCVFLVMGMKILGRVGTHFFFQFI